VARRLGHHNLTDQKEKNSPTKTDQKKRRTLMLTVTDRAAQALRTAIDTADQPGAGMRISGASPADVPDGNRRPTLRLDVVPTAQSDCELVVAPGGVQVFIEPDVASLLEDRTLDSSVDENGHAAFVVTTT
jgi:iron-sulfur cluster assembly protein